MTGLFSNSRVLTVSLWLLVIITSFTWNELDNIREKKAIATVTARAVFDQIIASRQWAILHGGIYVYTTPNSPPSPYISKERQLIHDTAGRPLTYMPPSTMIRQIASISRDNGQAAIHITSLSPLRPENTPFPWEIPWLQAFTVGSLEEGDFAIENGLKVFHYMAPLPSSSSCTSCHEGLDAVSGNFGGGISITLPSPCKKSPWPLLFGHLLVALGGTLGILFFGARLAHNRRSILSANILLESEIEERKETEKKLIAVQKNLGHLVDDRTAELRATNKTLDDKVTEQLKIESSLVAINDEFIQIFNSAPDGMHVIDRNFTVIRVNRAYCQLTGKGIEEIQGHKCYDVFAGKLCHTEHCPLTQICNGAKRIEVEAIKTRADGSHIPCIVTATPFREPGGKLTGIIEVTRDITNWKNIEQSLSATAEHLRARNTELEDFTHVISHDLQEPLILIQAFSDRIRDKCATTLPPKGITYLERIESSTNRMQNLIDGLLLYSRVSSKAIPFEKVRLHTVINTVLEDLAIKIEKTQARIYVDSDLPPIEADPLQMRQLFQNLIGNSLKYCNTERNPEISITKIPFTEHYDNKRYLRFCIKDNGIGFNDEYKKIIFDIFQRLHTRQQFHGTGIGLSICKKIVERHRGSIHAEGYPDQGAMFTLTLPLVQKDYGKDNEHDNSNIDIIMNRR